MTESELWEKRKEPSVPPELKFTVDRNDVLKLWDQWHEIKRKKTPVMPDIEMEFGLETGLTGAEIKEETNGDAEEAKNDHSEPPELK
jgi:hypothetical protein